jgi:hypothetical protein
MQIFNIMLKPAGAAGYVAAGQLALDDPPLRGASIAIEFEGRTLASRVDELFVPPGCDEHCIATIFASAA